MTLANIASTTEVLNLGFEGCSNGYLVCLIKKNNELQRLFEYGPSHENFKHFDISCY